MKNQSKYYAVRSRTLAHAIQFVCGENFYKYNDDVDNSLIYSFKRTEKFNKAYSDLMKIRQPLNK